MPSTATEPTAPPSSSGPGHRPFKAAARVRIPLGARPARPAPRVGHGGRPIHSYRTGRATRPWSRGSAAPPDLGLQRGEALVYGGSHHYRRAGGMLLRAKAVAFCSPHHGDTSTTVGGTRSCRAAWSARHPVKVEVAGSNPVRTAGIPGEFSLGSQPGQVAQSV